MVPSSKANGQGKGKRQLMKIRVAQSLNTVKVDCREVGIQSTTSNKNFGLRKNLGAVLYGGL